MTPAIEMSGLVVGYGHEAVVDGLDLTVGPGGLLALMGTNGSGKSTVLKTLAGLLAPMSGTVRMLGSEPGASPVDVAYLCQSPPSSTTLPLRAADIVATGRYARLGLFRRPSATDRELVDDAMRRMGVVAFADKPLLELSGGQRQRTHLAQAIARHARVLLVDEPTAGLDASGRATFAEVIAEERARGCAVVVSTHDIEDAETADTVVLLAPGIVEIGSPDRVLTDANLRRTFGTTGPHHGAHHDHGH
jgi:ABC-type Mn2+/Zn2+ transport system ATPase subunit